jgi:OOP family OmpA-OmpF porin
MGWTPYAGAGIGIAFLDGNFQTAVLDLEIDDQEFAYQFMAGGSKSLSSSVDLFLEYRYFATTEFDLVNNTPVPPIQFGEDAYEANNLFVGFRFYR